MACHQALVRLPQRYDNLREVRAAIAFGQRRIEGHQAAPAPTVPGSRWGVALGIRRAEGGWLRARGATLATHHRPDPGERGFQCGAVERIDRVLARDVMGLRDAYALDVQRGAGQADVIIIMVAPAHIDHVEAEGDVKGADAVSGAGSEVTRRIVVVADESPAGKALLVTSDNGRCEPLLETLSPARASGNQFTPAVRGAAVPVCRIAVVALLPRVKDAVATPVRGLRWGRTRGPRDARRCRCTEGRCRRAARRREYGR